MKINAKRSTEALESIRASLNDRATMPVGTIIRFVRRKQFGKTFLADDQRSVNLSYAAIYVSDRWYLTGTAGVGTSSYTNKEFMDLLAGEDYTEIAVATEFETI